MRAPCCRLHPWDTSLHEHSQCPPTLPGLSPLTIKQCSHQKLPAARLAPFPHHVILGARRHQDGVLLLRVCGNGDHRCQAVLRVWPLVQPGHRLRRLLRQEQPQDDGAWQSQWTPARGLWFARWDWPVPACGVDLLHQRLVAGPHHRPPHRPQHLLPHKCHALTPCRWRCSCATPAPPPSQGPPASSSSSACRLAPDHPLQQICLTAYIYCQFCSHLWSPPPCHHERNPMTHGRPAPAAAISFCHSPVLKF